MTNKSAANRYARALLDVAIKEKGDLQRIEADLAAFVDLFTEHPVAGLLSSRIRPCRWGGNSQR